MCARRPAFLRSSTFTRTAVALALTILIARPVSGQRTDVQEIVSGVALDSLMQTVRILTGEQRAVTPDSSFRISSRWHDDNDAALEFVRHELRRLGYSVTLQAFEQGTNVIAVRGGSIHPEWHVILCAHYDDVLGTPGADDNASGTAIVLEAARVLAHYSADRTVVFALWDAEEVGLHGSAHYAGDAAASGRQIDAVINLDMLAWDGDGDGVLEIHSDTASASLAADVANAAQVYGIDVQPVIKIPGTAASDHASFWHSGYPAVLLIEEYRGGDFNPYYHRGTDVIGHFNEPYFLATASASIAAVAELAVLVGPSTAVESTRSGERPGFDVYPSPFESRASVTYQVPAAGPVRIVVYDVLGRKVDVVEDTWHTAGSYVKDWRPIDVAPGLYLITLETTRGTEALPVVKVD